MDKQPGSD